MKSITDIRKIVNFCRKNGIIRFKDDGFEFDIAHAALNLKTKPMKEEMVPISTPNKQDEEMAALLWSSTPEGLDA